MENQCDPDSLDLLKRCPGGGRTDSSDALLMGVSTAQTHRHETVRCLLRCHSALGLCAVDCGDPGDSDFDHAAMEVHRAQTRLVVLARQFANAAGEAESPALALRVRYAPAGDSEGIGTGEPRRPQATRAHQIGVGGGAVALAPRAALDARRLALLSPCLLLAPSPAGLTLRMEACLAMAAPWSLARLSPFPRASHLPAQSPA